MRAHFAFRSLVAPATILALAAISGCADPRYCDGSHTDGQTDAPPADDGGCDPPQHQCFMEGIGYCYAIDDPNHCGESCEECFAPTNGTPTCDGTSCDFTCDTSYWRNNTTTTCDPCSDAAHCGASCMACSGDTPDCSSQGDACVCDASSCSGTTPVCDSTSRTCRACQAHSDCASGACDPSGGCVAVGGIIYVDQNDTAHCIDSGNGAGDPGTPYCDFSKALAATTGTRFHIVVRAGTNTFNSDTNIQDKTVVIIGAGADTTELVQNKNNTPVLKLTGTANVTLDGLTLRTTASPGAQGILCSGNGSTVLAVRRCIMHDNPIRGIEANQCTVAVIQSIIHDNPGGGIFLTDSDFVIENCLVYRNGSTGTSCNNTNKVGGVRISGNGTATTDRFVNNTVADNNACNSIPAGVQCDPATTVDVRNSIVWANITGSADPQLGGTGCTTTSSWVQGAGGATDPFFKGGAPFDYHLQTSPPDANSSLCINAGTAIGAPAVDLDGKDRTNTPDIGCYEAQ